MSEETKRQAAIELFFQEKKSAIYISNHLGRTRQWVYNWIKRYEQGSDNWYKDKSKRPKVSPSKISDALQMDNELSFRGSNRHPRSLGIVLRLALSFNVVPVFIPIKEPWRNGVVERYNQTYERHVLKSVYCQNVDELCVVSDRFAAFHFANHRYSSQNNRTPEQMEIILGKKATLDPDYVLPKQIPLEEGVIL